jgi:quercetin dioxygenase-like cupin family protein
MAGAMIVLMCVGHVVAEAGDDIRRVVTIDAGQGTSHVLADGPAGNVIEVNQSRVIRLWQAEAVPVSLPVLTDAGASAASPYFDGFRGASFYISEIPGGDAAPVIPLHQHPTMDFIAVMEGEIYLTFTDREVHLRAGDTLVNAGTLHTWENRSDSLCRIVVVTLAGVEAGHAPGADSE